MAHGLYVVEQDSATTIVLVIKAAEDCSHAMISDANNDDDDN